MHLTVERHAESARYRPDIDALRAVAVAGVLGFHAFPDALPGGFVGVDVFFVVSGYLISGILWRGLDDGSFRLRQFYERRARRILPALVLVLATALAAGWFMLLPLEYAQLGKHVLGGVTLTSNLVLWKESGYFDNAAELKPLLHLWSLAIEEQFYLVWPLILCAARRLRVQLYGVALPVLLASFAANVWIVSKNSSVAFYAPWTRVWELALGALIVRSSPVSEATISPRLRDIVGIVGALVIVGSMFVLTRQTPFPGWAALLPTIGTCFVILAGAESWLNRTLSRSRVVIFVGLVSYPLYLWHWPLLSFARILSLETPPVEIRIAALVLAMVAAYATYVLVERPIRRSGRTVIVAWLAAAMAALGGVGLVVVERRGVAERMPEPLRQYVSVPYEMNADVNLTCWPSGDDPSYPDACVDRDKPGPAVLVWGDSHAARLSAGIRRVVGERARMAQYTRSSCPPILEHGTATCRAANAFVLGKIREAKPEVIVLSANWLQHGRAWTANDSVARLLEVTLRELTRAGPSRILVLGPVPQWRGDLPRLLATATLRDVPSHRVPVRMTFGLEPLVRQVDDALALFVAGMDRVTYVSSWKLLCDQSGCLTRLDDTSDGLVTWDYGHLTTKGAVHLVRALASAYPGVLTPQNDSMNGGGVSPP